ncbi:metal-sulfur cluster assembly factor [Candidatus Roizmanbacteria bacterium]|nr:metal-sulfur cluster assembly factor [Candidatus Roizmanbacteria bacterium]
MQITEKKIKEKLQEVIDPELNISIVDLGLVYNVDLNKSGMAKITMTLTTIGCPLFSQIEQEARSKLKELGLAEEKIEFELTFDPPWSMDKMSERAKAMLGI